jgi:hypothetical protein
LHIAAIGTGGVPIVSAIPLAVIAASATVSVFLYRGKFFGKAVDIAAGV